MPFFEAGRLSGQAPHIVALKRGISAEALHTFQVKPAESRNTQDAAVCFEEERALGCMNSEDNSFVAKWRKENKECKSR
jgi:hypothetical protein